MTRRDAIAVLASTAALPLMSSCSGGTATESSKATATPTDADALKLLDEVADSLLKLGPEGATSLGIDTGARAALRSELTDRSEAGKQRLASQVRADLDRVKAFDVKGLSHAARTSVEVVRSAYATALEGFALPYGDITVGGWRNTPYVVIQNVGAYLDVPRFLDSDHPIETAADADAYLARLQSYAKQLDGELGRMQAARGAGLVPPAFLIDKAIAQMTLSAKNASEGGPIVESIERRTKARNIAGDWAARARAHRGQGDRTGARAAADRTAPATKPRDRRRRHRRASAWRGVLPLGAQGLDDDDHVAGRGPRDGPERAEAAARADGRDPEGDRLRAGLGRRADEGAGEGPALQVLGRRQGPRRDHGLHQGSARVDQGADAARLQDGRQSEHGSEAAAARGGARRARRLRRRRIDRRQDPRPILDQPPDDGAAQQVQPGRPDVSTSRSRVTSGRANTHIRCR